MIKSALASAGNEYQLYYRILNQEADVRQLKITCNDL